MSVTAKVLINPVQALAANTTQYVAPSGVRTIIDKFTGTNTTGVPATLTINLVQVAGVAGPGNVILSAKTIAAGECYTCPEVVGHVLGPGDFIVTNAGTAAAITVRASGREVG